MGADSFLSKRLFKPYIESSSHKLPFSSSISRACRSSSASSLPKLAASLTATCFLPQTTDLNQKLHKPNTSASIQRWLLSNRLCTSLSMPALSTSSRPETASVPSALKRWSRPPILSPSSPNAATSSARSALGLPSRRRRSVPCVDKVSALPTFSNELRVGRAAWTMHCNIRQTKDWRGGRYTGTACGNLVVEKLLAWK